ncbi:hypothetical protein JKP88DRAFT_214282 [Tribonema minus]|uniref:DUF2061 domain-containing protein n=1 Tax=Tribonema minus TaxID=303371 RepID=A0A836CRK4_9STRA|nr:hypothetical protein JKP88DRAFT_214282 [Tribonema minus]
MAAAMRAVGLALALVTCTRVQAYSSSFAQPLAARHHHAVAPPREAWTPTSGVTQLRTRRQGLQQMSLTRALIRAVGQQQRQGSVQLRSSPQDTSTPPTDTGKALYFTETTMRSLAKAVVWRVTAAVITLISGLVFSKNLKTAASIVGSDFVTKSGFMFLGERVWNKVNWGKGAKTDGAKRSLAKALLWRVFAAGNTLICGAFLAGDLSVALKIAGSDTVFKTFLFYINERMWARVEWGKEYEIEFVI